MQIRRGDICPRIDVSTKEDEGLLLGNVPRVPNHVGDGDRFAIFVGFKRPPGSQSICTRDYPNGTTQFDFDRVEPADAVEQKG